MESKIRRYITDFSPKISGLDSATEAELGLFRAGAGFENFDRYIQRRSDGESSEAEEDAAAGRGVTLLIWNMAYEPRELTAYFTLSVTAIPYDDGIEDEEFSFSNYPSIPAAEIKMFAVSEKYQDVFFKSDDLDMPVSAWCLQAMVHYADVLSRNQIGFQALLLHSVPTAEQFYKTNGFSDVPPAAELLYSIDQEYRAMWMAIKEVLLQ